MTMEANHAVIADALVVDSHVIDSLVAGLGVPGAT